MIRQAALLGSAALALALAPPVLAQDENPLKRLRQLMDFVGSVLSPKALELKALVDERRFEDAARFYAEHAAALDRDEETVPPLLEATAQGLNEGLAPPLAALAARLAGAPREGPAHWPALREELAQASRLLEAYDAIALLRKPAYRASAAGELERAYLGVRDELARRSGIAFAESALSLSADFFAVYPVEVPRDAVLAAAESAKLRSP